MAVLMPALPIQTCLLPLAICSIQVFAAEARTALSSDSVVSQVVVTAGKMNGSDDDPYRNPTCNLDSLAKPIDPTKGAPELAPWRLKGEVSKWGQLERTTYLSERYEARYETTWSVIKIGPGCEAFIGKSETIKLHDRVNSVMHTFTSGRRPGRWKVDSVSKSRTAPGKTLVSVFDRVVGSPMAGTRSFLRYECQMHVGRLLDRETETCFLVDPGHKLPAVLRNASPILYSKFPIGAKGVAEITVTEVRINELVPLSMYRPPADADILDRSATKPLSSTTETEPE